MITGYKNKYKNTRKIKDNLCFGRIFLVDVATLLEGCKKGDNNRTKATYLSSNSSINCLVLSVINIKK